MSENLSILRNYKKKLKYLTQGFSSKEPIQITLQEISKHVNLFHCPRCGKGFRKCSKSYFEEWWGPERNEFYKRENTQKITATNLFFFLDFKLGYTVEAEGHCTWSLESSCTEGCSICNLSPRLFSSVIPASNSFSPSSACCIAYIRFMSFH